MTFEQWRQDVRHAWRALRRAKAFTAAAVLTLAVGIAGTAAMYALIQGVLLRPLPVHEQDRLIVAWKELASAGFTHAPFQLSEIDALVEESKLLESMAGVDYNGAWPWVVIENGSASYIRGVPVTGDLFGVLGVAPLLGRALMRGDDVTSAEKVIVISHALWQRRYGGSHTVIGRTLMVREASFRIVGVMPPGFEYPRGVEAWMTIRGLESTLTDSPYGPLVDLVARLRPGVTVEQASSELRGLITRFEADAPAGFPRGLTPVVRTYDDVIVGDVRAAMLILFGAVGLVLLVASANVANLLLMRGTVRRSELAVRSALGASRGRLARQLLAESVVLALAAGALGLVATAWGLQALIAFVPEGLPRIESIRIDVGVVLFTVGVAFVTAALAGLAPALAASRAELGSRLCGGGRGAMEGGVRQGRRALVVAQVAVAVTVVATAGLLTRSLFELQSVDLGLTVERLVFVELALPQAKYAQRERHLQLLDDVVGHFEAAPSIQAATPVSVPPFSGARGWDAPMFTAEGRSAGRTAVNPELNLEAIHPSYFSTFGVTLVRGRGFTDADREGAPHVVIVSEDVAERTWPGVDPIGKRMKIGGADSEEPWRTVVGVVKPTRYRELTEPRATLYLPARQIHIAGHMIVLRTAAPLNATVVTVRERVRAVDPDVQVMRVAPFAELLAGPLARPRFNAFLIGVFGAAALLLAAIGLYAVLAAHVRQRYTEIGIRIALGASRADVRRLVLAEGLRLAGTGAIIGLVSAVLATRLLRGLLFGVHPLDPLALLAAALLLVGVSAFACYLPARRAMRVDPVAMLRGD